MKLSPLYLLIFLIISCREQTAIQPQSKAESTNWAMLGFVKADSINPILQPDTSQVFNCPLSKQVVHWEERNVLNPSAVVRNGKVYLLYRAQDHAMTSRLGLAVSNDGLHFTKQANPVLYPTADAMQQYEWKGGVEDPRLVETADGTYILTYTSYDGKTARLCLATSKDLEHWTKQGLVLNNEKYKDRWSKSGAIITQQKGDKIVAVQINGRYWMYFGDTDLFLASSTDLIHWTVAENEENQQMISVLHPRMGYFDSRLVEPGPYALLKQEGILLIYNGSNAANFSDSSMPKFTYSAGQALFDAHQPWKLIARTDQHFISPDKDYEKIGEVNEVCFVEGLVHFNNHWFLYYGTADSKIAVAVKE